MSKKKAREIITALIAKNGSLCPMTTDDTIKCGWQSCDEHISKVLENYSFKEFVEFIHEYLLRMKYLNPSIEGKRKKLIKKVIKLLDKHVECPLNYIKNEVFAYKIEKSDLLKNVGCPPEGCKSHFPILVDLIKTDHLKIIIKELEKLDE